MAIVGNTRIVAPVTIKDVKDILGSAKYNIESLCTDPHINKWAKYKPLRVNKIEPLNQEDRQSANQGLIAKKFVLPDSLEVSVIPDTIDWVYNGPVGKKASPYRLSDFVGDSNTGYDSNAKPPSQSPNDISLPKNKIDGDVYVTVKCKLGESSYANIGGVEGKVDLPINQLNLGSNLNNGTWRFGVAAYVPNDSGNYTIRLFSSTGTIPTNFLNNMGNTVLPRLYTNTQLIEDIKNNEDKPITCIVFLSNSLILNDNGNGSRWVSGGSNNYFLPHGGKFTITATSVENSIKCAFESASISYQQNWNNIGGITFNTNNEGVTLGLARPSSLGITQKEIKIEMLVNITKWPVQTTCNKFECKFFGHSINDTTGIKISKENNGTWSDVTSVTGIGKYKFSGYNTGSLLDNINAQGVYGTEQGGITSGVGYFNKVSFTLIFTIGNNRIPFNTSRAIKITR